jgi:hypothetical protein
MTFVKSRHCEKRRGNLSKKSPPSSSLHRIVFSLPFARNDMMLMFFQYLVIFPVRLFPSLLIAEVPRSTEGCPCLHPSRTNDVCPCHPGVPSGLRSRSHFGGVGCAMRPVASFHYSTIPSFPLSSCDTHPLFFLRDPHIVEACPRKGRFDPFGLLFQ